MTNEPTIHLPQEKPKRPKALRKILQKRNQHGWEAGLQGTDFAVNRRLRAGSQQFKGLTDTDYYEENGLVKYTYGESTQYSEILKKRREVLDKFPQAFIVAFVDGERIDLIKARKMSQKNKRKRCVPHAPAKRAHIRLPFFNTERKTTQHHE